MALPEQVVRNANRANDAHKQAYRTPEEKAAPVENEQPKIDPNDYKERYARYKETTDNTIYQLRQDLAAAQGRNASLETRMASLEERLKQAPEPQPFQLSKEDLDVVDEETMEVINKIVDARVQPVQRKLDDTEAKLSQTEAELKRERDLRVGRDARTTHETFKDKLRSLVADCDDIDKDPKFIQWLNGIDEFSGRPRRELAVRSMQVGDVRRVADIYKEWQGLQGRSADPRESMITPRRGADMEQGQPQGRIWTGADIKEFYKRKGLGMIDENEARLIEQDIFAAQKQGRVR